MFLLNKVIILLFFILFKASLNRDNVQYDHEIGQEVPSNAGVLIDNLMAHVSLNIWQFFRAVTCINEEGDLCIQINYSASATIAVQKQAA